jgi:hypothetical protein
VIAPRRLLAALPLALVGAAAALAAPVAQADVVSINTCNSNTLNQVFSPWADPANYELAPGGDFESSAWSLSGGAQIVSGSEPFAVTGSSGSSSLSLPTGASAVSPSTCVTAAYPDIRFFVSGVGVVGVNVIYGNTVIPSGLVAAGGPWQPGNIVVTGSAIAGVVNGGTANVSIQLIGLSGNPKIDDVYIDPWQRS